VEDAIVALIVVPILFIGLPWLIFHYVTKWKTAKTLTNDDEQLLDDLYEAARRLDDRLCTIERIISADAPDWKRNCPPTTVGAETRLLDQFEQLDNDPLTRSRRKAK
jgi:phage shock protein B